ncbi:MAG: hypothetical protein FJ164_15235, partial [Gammaproteobacteria bacterium]|nr:hypothetical protein [Gammaproteobacteria bacterium]
MRLIGWMVKLTLLAALLALVAAPFVLLQPKPLVEASLAFDQVEAKRARALLQSLPRNLDEGEVRQIDFRPEEIELALNYALQQLGGGGARMAMDDRYFQAQVSMRLPFLPIPRYLNLELSLFETEDRPLIDALRIGPLAVPQIMARSVFSALLGAGSRALGLPGADAVLKQVSFSPTSLNLTYQWDTRFVEAVRGQLIPLEDVARLREFHQHLVATLVGRQGAVSLPEVAAPLFELAVTRAAAGDPVADNRAALMVLSAYVGGRSLQTLVPEAADWPAARRVSVRLHGRVDLAKHFINSAVLAATGGELISQAIGLSKELDDSRGGSGFSFIDLLADEAGTRLGKRVTESRVMARELQQRTAATIREADWMPAPDGLQESMTEAEFTQRYGGVGGAG